MRRTSFRDAECPIARGVDLVGDCWTMLILRDAFDGLSRFDQFEASLGISPAMLTKRLGELVANGLLEKVAYQQRPVRYEYRLTESGVRFQPVLVALYEWVERDTPVAQRSRILVDGDDVRVDPVVVDQRTGRPLAELDIRFRPTVQ